jgi:LEA14-like dessication related protein
MPLAAQRATARLLFTIWVLSSVAGCAGFGGYRDAPRVSLVSIKPLELGLLEQRYRLVLRILNPNSIDLPLAGLSYSLEVNEREFAYGVSRQAVTIPALGEAVLEVDVISSLLDVLQQAQQLGAGQPAALDYRLSGKINLANSALRLPFDYSGRLDWQAQPASTGH